MPYSAPTAISATEAGGRGCGATEAGSLRAGSASLLVPLPAQHSVSATGLGLHLPSPESFNLQPERTVLQAGQGNGGPAPLEPCSGRSWVHGARRPVPLGCPFASATRLRAISTDICASGAMAVGETSEEA